MMKLLENVNLLQIVLGFLIVYGVDKNIVLVHEMGHVYAAKCCGAPSVWITMYHSKRARTKLLKFPPFMRNVPIVYTTAACADEYDRDGNVIKDHSHTIAMYHATGFRVGTAKRAFQIVSAGVKVDLIGYLTYNLGIVIGVAGLKFLPPYFSWIAGLVFFIYSWGMYMKCNLKNPESDLSRSRRIYRTIIREKYKQ